MPRREQRGAAPRRRAPRAATAGLAAAAAMLLASCAAGPAEGGGARTVHADGAGPLSASRGVGGNALLAPAAKTWTGTFGAFVLCLENPGLPVEIERVRVASSVEPVTVVPMVRTTSPAELRGLEPRQRKDYLPTYGALGSPPGFTEPYIDAAVPGAYSKKVRGWRVEQSCHQNP